MISPPKIVEIVYAIPKTKNRLYLVYNEVLDKGINCKIIYWNVFSYDNCRIIIRFEFVFTTNINANEKIKLNEKKSKSVDLNLNCNFQRFLKS